MVDEMKVTALDEQAGAVGAKVLETVLAEATGGDLSAAESILRRIWPRGGGV